MQRERRKGEALLYFLLNEVEILNAVERLVYLMGQKETREQDVVGKPRKGHGSQKGGVVSQAAKTLIKFVGEQLSLRQYGSTCTSVESR